METTQNQAAPLQSKSAAIPAFAANRTQLAAAVYSYLLGWFYWRGVWLGNPLAPFSGYYVGMFHPIVLGVFCLLFFGGAAFFLRRVKRPATTESWCWLGFSLLLLADILLIRPLFFGKNYYLGQYNPYNYGFYGWEVFALHLAAMYWLVCRAGLLTGGKTGFFAPVDALSALVGRPFRWIFLRIQVVVWAIKSLYNRHKSKSAAPKRDVTGAVVGLCILIPLLLMALLLLMGADSGFAQTLNGILNRLWLPNTLELELLQFVVSLPVGAYLYGAIGSALRQSPDPKKQQRWQASLEKSRFLPQKVMTLGVGLFCLLYLLFFVVQVSYLIPSLFGTLPQGFVASDYARQGFFQLCAVVVLNFGVLLLALLLVKGSVKRHSALQVMLTALLTANLLFVVVSAAKMGLYVSLYGITDKRILSSWVMLVLAVVTVLAMRNLFHPFDWVRHSVFVAAGLFLALCLCQPQALSYKANLALYKSGVISQLDGWTLARQHGRGNQYAFAHDLIAAGWGKGLSVQEVQDVITGYSGYQIYYRTGEQGQRQAYVVLYDAPDGQPWAVLMNITDDEMTKGLELVPLSRLKQQ